MQVGEGRVDDDGHLADRFIEQGELTEDLAAVEAFQSDDEGANQLELGDEGWHERRGRVVGSGDGLEDDKSRSERSEEVD